LQKNCAKIGGERREIATRTFSQFIAAFFIGANLYYIFHTRKKSWVENVEKAADVVGLEGGGV